jgi:hypothetical protein
MISPTVPANTRSAEIKRAVRIKRNNAITATLTGGALAVAADHLYGIGPPALAPLAVLLGVAGGLLYANAFEYVLHRFLLHWGNGFLVQRHALHHNSAGADDEARYINFASSPLVVVLVFVLNAPVVLAAQFVVGRYSERLRAGAFGAGMFAGFTIYYIAYEAIHWRIHMGGWLPKWMKFARRHHMLHHAEVDGHYSVFLPIFDWIFTRREGKRGVPTSH